MTGGGLRLGRILKYPLTLGAEQRLTVSAGSRVVALQLQDGIPTLWLLTVAQAAGQQPAPREEWLVRCVGTGWEVWGLDEWTHLGTVADGGFVWHFFRQEAGQ